MAPRAGKYQAGFNSGELDERAQGRTDIKQYYQAASRMQRAMPVPQGGFSNEALLGTKALGRMRRPLVMLDAFVIGFNGPGALGSLLDITTLKGTNAIGAGTAVLVTVDLGMVRAISAFDCYELQSTNVVAGRVLACETSLDNLAWERFGGAFAVDIEARTRRFALAPGAVRLARYVRLIVVAAASAPGVCTLRGIRVQGEAATGGTFRIRRFPFSRAEHYQLVFTVDNVDVWRDRVWQAAIPLALSDDQVATFDGVQQLDTMFILHEDAQPRRIMRQGADDEWNCWAAPFRRIPEVDYGATYTNGLPAIYSVQLVNVTLPASFALTIGGEDTEAIDVQGSEAATANQIKLLVEALPSVEPGVTVTYDAGREAYDISFTGAGNEGDGWSMIGRMITPASAAIVVSRRQKGKAGGEALMSAARGWPSCGAIYQQRLVLGGFRSKPNAWLASLLGDYYDFAIDIVADTGAYLGAVDTVGAERIERIVFGTFLQFLSNEREYYLTDQSLKRNQAPNIRKATNNGIRSGVPAVETDNATLFSHENGANIVKFVYSDAEQNYVSTNISVLSSSLLTDIRDMAFRGATSADDAGALLVVNADGSMRVFVMLEQQDVTAAPGRFETDGKIRACCVAADKGMYIGVERETATGTVQCFELISDEIPLDAWIRVTLPAPARVVSHPDLATYHEGATVWAIADGVEIGPLQVAGGSITLPEPCSDIYVGRWTPTLVQTLPVPKDAGDGVVLDRPVRPTAVRANVIDTSSLAIGSETDGPFPIDLSFYGGPADTPLLANPYTGQVDVEGLAGYSDEGKVILTQLKPGRLSVRDITVETER